MSDLQQVKPTDGIERMSGKIIDPPTLVRATRSAVHKYFDDDAEAKLLLSCIEKEYSILEKNDF